MIKQRHAITLLILIFLLFASCRKASTISGNDVKEIDSLEIIENLEQTITPANEDLQPCLTIKEGIARPFIEALKSDDRNEILKYLHYPIARLFPSPYIENEQEMLEEFDMIFTDELINDIVNSSDDEWLSEAWRGIVLKKSFGNNLWMDYDGKVFSIPASNKGKELAKEFWIKDKERLLPEFQSFDSCVGLFASSTYLLRIDKFTVDNDTFTYSYRTLLWERNNGKTMSDMPDIILTNGKAAYSGSYPVGRVHFIDDGTVYVMDMPDYDHYGNKGELFIL